MSSTFVGTMSSFPASTSRLTIAGRRIVETGSWDPALGAFTPTKFLGSPNSSVCATGIDQLSYVQGISSNLFMEFNVSVGTCRVLAPICINDYTIQGVPISETEIGPIIEGLQENFPESGIRLDTSALPNPFVGVSSATFPDTDQAFLSLVDGGLDGEVTPYQPLLVKARKVDTILAIDAVRIVRAVLHTRQTHQHLSGRRH